MKTWQRPTHIAVACGLALASWGSVGLTTASSAAATPTVLQDGPHSPAHRAPAATTVTTSAGVSVSRYDLGDVEVGAKPGQFRAPMRGSLITPAGSSSKPSKLVVVSHLRSAGCADRTFAFPCPGNEIRLDRGMEYFGKALAAQGYTVLIPDVAPVWIGTTLKAPYDQVQAWLKVVGGTRKALAEDVTGHSQHFHLPLTGRVDLTGAGLVVHSRSGFIAGPAIDAWRHGPMPITSVLAYGPAYDVPDAENHVTAPVASDVPYLGLVGDHDHDVPFNADLWLGENIEQSRTAMAAVATVPGLGHNYINQALSSTHTDDRLDCEGACPGAAVHEKFLTTVATQYFDATLRGHASSMPLSSSSALPATLGGLSAQWMAVTNSTRRVTLLDADAVTTFHVSKGSSAKPCRFYDSQDPTTYPDRCAEPDSGTVELISHVQHLTLAKGGTLTVPTKLTGASALDLQLTPYGDRADHAASSPLEVSVTTQQGGHVKLTLPAAAARVLADRFTEDTNGTYTLGTIRIPLPAELATQTITSVVLTAPKGGSYALRAIDAVGSSDTSGTSGTLPSHPTTPSSSPTTPAPAQSSKPAASSPSKPSASSTGAPGAVGPIVQTDYIPG